MRLLHLNAAAAAGRYARSFYQSLANRRKYERVPVSGNITVSCGGIAVETKHLCSCIDASPRGLGIDSPEPLAPATIVALVADEQGVRRMARVCYCEQRGAGYRIGLEFTAITDQPGSNVS